jgi:hypothetical protein
MCFLAIWVSSFEKVLFQGNIFKGGFCHLLLQKSAVNYLWNKHSIFQCSKCHSVLSLTWFWVLVQSLKYLIWARFPSGRWSSAWHKGLFRVTGKRWHSQVRTLKIRSRK